MNKAYNRINWENYPSMDTPLNEQNLNRMDGSLDEIDNRVITLDTTKATKEEVSPLIKEISFNESNGVFTITRKNGSKFTIDTKLEKIAINFGYDPVTQRISLTLIDGTIQYIDLSALITQYEFMDTDTVSFFIDENGKISAIVKEGSIQEKHLRPNYLAEIKVEAAKAQLSESNAAQSAVDAENSKKLAESYTHGGTGIREGEDDDNAKKYKELAEQAYENLQKGVVTGVKGEAETNFRQGNVNVTPENIGLGNVPNVTTNDQTPTFTQAATRENIASGNKLSVIFGKIMKWFADLKTVAFSGSYNDLSNKPSIGAATITIKQNGAVKGTFTVNQNENTTIELTDNNTVYSLPLAASGTRGGVKIGYPTNGKNYPVQLSNEQAFVSVPWTDNNTWKANTAASEGYVAKGSGQANKVWKTDGNGNPGWRDDANSWRGIQNNLTSTATDQSLSAAQGKALKGMIDEINTGLYRRLYIAIPFFNSDFSGSRNFNAGETVVLFFNSTYENDYIRFYRNNAGGGKYFDIKKPGYYRIIAHFGVAPGIYKMQLKNSTNTVLYREACGADRQTIELTMLFTSVASLMLLLTVNDGGMLYSDATYSVVEFEYLGNY